MTLKELKNKIEDLSIELNGLREKAERNEATTEDLTLSKELMAERTELKEQLETREALAATAGEEAGVGRVVDVVGPMAEQDSYNLGEYLQDIAKSARQIQSGGVALPRVVNYQEQVKAAATGNQESVGSEGGFLVGEEFTNEIVKRAYDNNQVISRVSKRTLTKGNKVSINGVDETDRADGSRHGGIRSYWLSEAENITASRPTFRQMDFELKKHGILYYATDEVLEDAELLQEEVQEAVSDELAFATQAAIVNGDGAGKPLGILQSPALVSQDKETGQSAATIVYENILKMYTRKWGPMNRYVWLINQEVVPQLATMNIEVGTGGAPVYLPSGGAAGAPFQTLLTAPVIEIEQCAALGTVGDIVLADLSQYRITDKGGVKSAMSIHVQFTNDETVFRWITRVDGMPLWNSALTPYKGTGTRSPFVALKTRS